MVSAAHPHPKIPKVPSSPRNGLSTTHSNQVNDSHSIIKCNALVGHRELKIAWTVMYDSNDSQNFTQKEEFALLQTYRSYSILFNLLNVLNFSGAEYQRTTVSRSNFLTFHHRAFSFLVSLRHGRTTVVTHNPSFPIPTPWRSTNYPQLAKTSSPTYWKGGWLFPFSSVSFSITK